MWVFGYEADIAELDDIACISMMPLYQAELDDIVASDCPICGMPAINELDKPLPPLLAGPTVAFSPSDHEDGTPKDTTVNVNSGHNCEET